MDKLHFTILIFKLKSTSSHISELIKTCGVDVPGDERDDDMPPVSETDDVLLDTDSSQFTQYFIVVELFEFLRENSFDVLRDDSDTRYPHVHIYQISVRLYILFQNDIIYCIIGRKT